MKKTKAILMMLEIVNECETMGAENGACKECVFGTNEGRCLVSNGNDIPSDWEVNKKVREWMGGKS